MMTAKAIRLLTALLGTSVLWGCGGPSGTDAGDVVANDAVTTDTVTADTAMPDSGGPRCGATTVPCTDQSVSGLRLFSTVNPAMITEEGTTPGEFRTLIDARGGGMSPTQSYVYARFEDNGLTRVAISDEAAFQSLDWDIALRRFVIRLNSGVSGPSCVEAARTAPNTTFDSVTAVPMGLSFRTESYFTDTCELVNDGSGIGSPGTALASFWMYTTCVQMTGNVYVLRLRNGRHVRLQVLSYYDTAAQQACDETGNPPMPNGAGNLRIRWSFIN